MGTSCCELSAPLLDLVSGRSANWQTAHARVGGVQPLNLEGNYIGDGFIWSIQLGTVTVEAVRHMPRYSRGIDKISTVNANLALLPRG